MMAARGVDVPLVGSSFSLMFLVLVASGTNDGMSAVVYTCMMVMSLQLNEYLLFSGVFFVERGL